MDIWTWPGALVSYHINVGKPLTLSTQLPSYLTLYHKQSQGHYTRSLFPHLGTGLFIPPVPFRCVLFSLSRRGSTLRITEATSSLASIFLPFLCLCLCFDSLRKLSAGSFSLFWKTGLLNWLLISFSSCLLSTLQSSDLRLTTNLSACATQQYFCLQQRSESQQPYPLHSAPWRVDRQGLWGAAASRKLLTGTSWLRDLNISNKWPDCWKQKCWFKMKFSSPVHII